MIERDEQRTFNLERVVFADSDLGELARAERWRGADGNWYQAVVTWSGVGAKTADDADRYAAGIHTAAAEARKMDARSLSEHDGGGPDA